MPPLRPVLTRLSPGVHGARDYGELARLGLSPDAVVDFSTNSNPYGPPSAVLQAVSEAVSPSMLGRYPDRECLALREAIAAAEGLSITNVLPGNGAAELIQLVALALVSPGSRHLILAPTFGEYARAIQLLDGVAYEHRPPPSRDDFRFQVEEVAAAIDRFKPDCVWLCNPNNPTGQQWSAAELSELRATRQGRQALWIIDESYRYFAASPVSLPHRSEEWRDSQNLIVLRSLTKEYTLAGVRLGYALAAAPLIDPLRAAQPPWSVNSLAQVAGVAAMRPDMVRWRRQSLARLRGQASELWQAVAALGLTVLPTATTYALIAVPDATACRRNLLTHGLLVRDCTSFGLPGHIRVAARRPADNERLVAALLEFSGS